MRTAIWVRRANFDTSLDRTTWLGMASAMRYLGVDVTLIGSYERQPTGLPGPAKIIWIGPSPRSRRAFFPFLFQAWLHVLSEVVNNKTDYIILDVPTFLCAFPIDLLGRLGLSKTKVIMDLRTFDFGELSSSTTIRDRCWRALTWLALNYGKSFHFGLTVINKRLAQKVLEMGGHRNLCIWGSGYTIPAPTQRTCEHPTVRAIRNLAQSNFLVLYHGYLHENRGLFQAIEAVALARARGIPVFFALVGGGPADEALRELIGKHPYTSCCRLFTPVPHAAIYEIVCLARAAMMTYPNLEYWDYNHPIKLTEYMAMGLPVICTDVPMFRDAVVNPDCLIWVPTAAPEAIAKVLTQCVQQPSILARSAGLAKHEAGNFTWRRQAERLVSFLSSGQMTNRPAMVCQDKVSCRR